MDVSFLRNERGFNSRISGEEKEEGGKEEKEVETTGLKHRSKFLDRSNLNESTCPPPSTSFSSIHSTSIRGVTYNLLGHQQLTIREFALKTFASYLTKCDFKVS